MEQNEEKLTDETTNENDFDENSSLNDIEDDNRTSFWKRAFRQENLELRFGLYFLIAASIIVFLFGIFSAIAFGTIITNLFIGAIIFFALGYGIGYLFRKYFPELLSEVEEESPLEDDELQTGSTVDYVVNQDDEEVSSMYEPPQQDEKQSKKENLSEYDKKTDSTDEFTEKDPEVMARALKTWIHEDD